MAKLVSILIVVMLPLLTRSQFQIVPSVPLKTLDDRTVIASSIIKQGQVTLMYYFDTDLIHDQNYPIAYNQDSTPVDLQMSVRKNPRIR